MDIILSFARQWFLDLNEDYKTFSDMIYSQLGVWLFEEKKVKFRSPNHNVLVECFIYESDDVRVVNVSNFVTKNLYLLSIKPKTTKGMELCNTVQKEMRNHPSFVGVQTKYSIFLPNESLTKGG